MMDPMEHKKAVLDALMAELRGHMGGAMKQRMSGCDDAQPDDMASPGDAMGDAMPKAPGEGEPVPGTAPEDGGEEMAEGEADAGDGLDPEKLKALLASMG